MKLVTKFGFAALMVLLLLAAFVLPKFVQRSEPPLPEKDLAAALAAVDYDEDSETSEATEPAPNEAQPPLSELSEDEAYSSFYQHLEEGNFEEAKEEILNLSDTVGAEKIALLTTDLETAISSLSLTGVESETMPDTAAAEFATGPVTVEAPVAESSPSESESSEAEPETGAVPQPGTSSVIAFYTLLQSGDFENADIELKSISPGLPENTVETMRSALTLARKREAERLEREQELNVSRKELIASQKEMARVQKESVAKIEKTVQQLAAATLAAKNAEETDEASTGKEPDPASPEPEEPIKIPETVSVSFGFDSTYLTDTNKETLRKSVVPGLESENRLTLQLRGHADPSGSSEYNGILARARCEMVKDYLVENGIAGDRIEVISFGETQAVATGSDEAKSRRVDVIFQKAK